MKKIILKYSNHIYLLTLVIILLVYLFPGDIVSYLISGNLNSNINYNENPIGYSFYWIVNTGVIQQITYLLLCIFQLLAFSPFLNINFILGYYFLSYYQYY